MTEEKTKNAQSPKYIEGYFEGLRKGLKTFNMGVFLRGLIVGLICGICAMIAFK